MSDPAPAFPSATVLLLRDLPRFEVLMVRRHRQIEFASGALVFPGGKLEESDRDAGWARHVAGGEGLSDIERALRICAVREAFEESGILLVGRGPEAAEAVEARAAAGREEVAAGRVGFREFVAELGLKLDLSAMTPFAHWITPSPMRKRFDTRFYLSAAPPDQVAACDGCETVDAEWVPPAEALRLGEAGERTIVFPTRLNLRLLAASTSITEALASAASRPVQPITPEVTRIDGHDMVSIPETAAYGIVPPERL
ncbi:NUDIX hydrolase [Enterovirga sp.]|uniref:NUDIX hydrolase n=1 Tax=Enterovirga sp. TaxID=2026350 RepID=UPI002BB4ECC7|nr:NUDIX hydrolase [Enterovirga sp.]HMO27939.1 NUDIX hydrolase [Enterovirga sp.]